MGVVTLAFVGILMCYLLHITHWSLVLAYFFGAWAKQYVSPLKTHFSRGLDLLMELGLAGLVPKIHSSEKSEKDPGPNGLATGHWP